ncbi:MAG: hypothetical protein ICV73_17975, partial [Acetobacteraceae bacterium]|nr:hypothetical protein [Acetobacteraceae bacterium]
MDGSTQGVLDDLERWHRDYRSPRDYKPDGVFEIGFCMAGAVSAGAYTAGVLDFFIEALDAFTQEREARLARGEGALLHEVRVPVLGGASAGGMCAAMAAVFLDARFPPVRRDTPEAERRSNPLYRAWVSDIDIRPLLGDEDVRSGRPLESLLDCTVLERIVDGLLDGRAAMETARRPWLASPLRAVLTLSNLRGVPYALGFEGSGLRHWMSHHADHVRFSIELDPRAEAAPEDPPKIGETPLDRAAPRGSGAREGFKAVALGTGGFPVALAPRVLTRPAGDYLYRAVLTPSGPLKDGVVLRPRPGWADGVVPAWRPAPPETYSALCVDGGAMNNEPLDLVRRVLAGHGATSPRPSLEARRALLLIDPFVDPGKPGPEAPCGLIGSILPLFSALVQNSRFKPEDLAMAADPAIGSRFLLAPSRGPDWEAEGAIAAGHLGGFLGFFARAYREHDYFLGRRNAQRFLDRVFVLPEDNPLFGPRWSDADKRRWGRERRGVAGRHLPVVPLCGAPAEHEERLPEWPGGRFDLAELEPLIRKRAKVAVPALTGALLELAFDK